MHIFGKCLAYWIARWRKWETPVTSLEMWLVPMGRIMKALPYAFREPWLSGNTLAW